MTKERELLSIVETLKECRNILLGQEIEVFTDHKNLVHKHFNTEQVMRWRLLLEDFSPKLTYVKGTNNIVADALSQLDITEEEVSAEMFADELVGKEEDFQTRYPLSYKELVCQQKKDRALQNKFRTQQNCTSRSHTCFRTKRMSMLLRTIRFTFLSIYNISVCAEW